jgi:hypothetical protein
MANFLDALAQYAESHRADLLVEDDSRDVGTRLDAKRLIRDEAGRSLDPDVVESPLTLVDSESAETANVKPSGE